MNGGRAEEICGVGLGLRQVVLQQFTFRVLGSEAEICETPIFFANFSKPFRTYDGLLEAGVVRTVFIYDHRLIARVHGERIRCRVLLASVNPSVANPTQVPSRPLRPTCTTYKPNLLSLIDRLERRRRQDISLGRLEYDVQSLATSAPRRLSIHGLRYDQGSARRGFGSAVSDLHGH